MPLLEIKNVTKKFDGLTALNEVSIQIEEGQIRGLIGPNGAGKSTLFKIIAGFYQPTEGDIRYQGQSIVDKEPSAIAQLGIVRTFQETTLFQDMSVLDNVRIGCHLQARSNVFEALFGLDRTRQQESQKRSLEILDFVGMADRQEQLAAELPLGFQRALAIAIGLAAQPKLLLMDEPFAGMNGEETGRMMELTRKICDQGVTIVLVEHDMKAVMGLCDYLTVLNFGSLLAAGTPSEIRQNEAVIEAYLGTTKNLDPV